MQFNFITSFCLQYSLTRVHRASSLNTDDSWMYEDGHDEIVFSVDQPCQLLGVGLCGTEGAYTAELELLEVGLLHTLRKCPTMCCLYRRLMDCHCGLR